MGEPTQAPNQDYQHIETVDVAGIEIFGSAHGVSNPPEAYQQATNRLPTGLTIKDAARLLGISPNTVRARIKSGELSAGKVKGPTGEQWMVFIGSLQTSYQEPTRTLPTNSITSNSIEVARLLDIVEKQAAKLEVASGQIGYLKSQLEERERELDGSRETIKLLTDSQAEHRSWWRRLGSWFRGSVR